MRKLFLLITHGLVGFAGFALGIYLLPILTAPKAPDVMVMAEALNDAQYQGEFVRDLKGSDFLHWGEGKLSLGGTKAVLEGSIAPGPDYKLYLSPVFVDDEQSFLTHKADMVRVAEVKTFNNFVVDLPENVQLDQYTTAVIWCETFSEFISAAKYR